MPSFNQIKKLLVFKQGTDERTSVDIKSFSSSSYFENSIVSRSLASECRIAAAASEPFVSIILWFKRVGFLGQSGHDATPRDSQQPARSFRGSRRKVGICSQDTAAYLLPPCPEETAHITSSAKCAAIPPTD